MRIVEYLLGGPLRLMARVIEVSAPRNETVASRWLRAPTDIVGSEVCIFLIYAPAGELSEHSLFHARAWAQAGFKVIAVVNTEAIEVDPSADALSFASGVLIRENRGYDFGAWASVISELPAIREASLLAIANDSMYGPLNTFGKMIERARELDADVVGVTESVQFGRHFQSFLIFFKRRALKSRAFQKFWSNVRAGGRTLAVYRYELGLVRTLERAALRCAALFPSADWRNPTLTRWRELIEDGLPYLKIALLRDNMFEVDISGWESILRDGGFDPALADRH